LYQHFVLNVNYFTSL